MTDSILQDFSCYTIRFGGGENANHVSASWLSSELGVPVVLDGVTEIEEDGRHTHVEDFWDWLEEFAASHCDATFVLEGYITNHGFDEDFKIEVSNGRLAAFRSGWYEGLSKDSFEDYEDFCDAYQDDEGEPICTEVEFDALGEDVFIFDSAGFGKQIVLGEVPLDGPATSREGLRLIGY